MSVKVEYKKALRQVRRDKVRTLKRLRSEAWKQLKAGRNRYMKSVADQVIENSGINKRKIGVMKIKKKYLKGINNWEGGLVHKMSAVAVVKRKGINAIHFIKGEPVNQLQKKGRKRKTIIIRVHKGRETRLRRGFVMKLPRRGAEEGHFFHLFHRHSKGYEKLHTVSIITILENTGYKLETAADDERVEIAKRMMRRMNKITRPLAS